MMNLFRVFSDAPANCTHSFLGLHPWFQYLNLNPSDCSINLDLTQSSNWNQLWLIGIVILDDLLIIAGAVAVGFIIYGAIRYVTSQGEPENVKAAQNTIFSAIIGLIIALIATNAVNFIGNQLGGSVGANGLPQIVANASLVQTILNIVFGLIGAIALLMIVIGGFKYVTSGGDSAKVNSAKNTIFYSLIGLAVSVFAFTIVNFIIVKLH
jgi:hypothetical protein